MIDVALTPLQPFLNGSGISEIMILPSGEVLRERHGEITPTGLTLDHPAVKRIGLALAEHAGIDFAPLMNGSLPTGERFQWTSEPVTRDGPSLTIRVQASRELSFADFGIDEHTAQAILKLIQLGHSLIVAGGTKSGKTSLTNLLLTKGAFSTARCLLIEDQAELTLPNSRSIRMQYDDEHSARQMMRAAVRMRPDHIILGEVRDAEAFELLQCVNTGHASSICTVHANKHQADTRLSDLASYSGRSISPTRFREAFMGVLHIERDPLTDLRTTTFIEWSHQ